jgi:hypothetical protein
VQAAARAQARPKPGPGFGCRLGLKKVQAQALTGQAKAPAFRPSRANPSLLARYRFPSQNAPRERVSSHMCTRGSLVSRSLNGIRKSDGLKRVFLDSRSWGCIECYNLHGVVNSDNEGGGKTRNRIRSLLSPLQPNHSIPAKRLSKLPRIQTPPQPLVIPGRRPNTLLPHEFPNPLAVRGGERRDPTSRRYACR